MKLMQFVGTTCLLFFTGISQATAPLPEQIRSSLEDKLYTFDNVVPGYQRPAVDAPKVAIAEFRVSNTELITWSKAISEILRYRIQYVPGVRLYMPGPTDIFVDAQIGDGDDRALLTDRNSFKSLGDVLGIETILTGSVERQGESFELTTELINIKKEGTTIEKRWEFAVADLPEVLISISEWVYSALGVELTKAERAYLSDRKSLDDQAIEDFITLYAELQGLTGPIRIDKINRLQKQHPEFVMFAIYALRNRVHAQTLDEAYTNLELYERLRASFEGNAGVSLTSYGVLEIDPHPKHVISGQLSGLKDLVKNSPDDPWMMNELGINLTVNGNTLEGIATLLEAVDRWPDNYRIWWSLGWAVNKHAWQVRGSSIWRKVPKKAKDQFETLSLLANSTIDEALAINQHNKALWNMKINTLGSMNGYTEELMEVFERAAQLGPNHDKTYRSALNYAQNKWGGNADSRRRIIELAIKNNPDEAWPMVLRRQNSVDFDSPPVEQLDNVAIEEYLKQYLKNMLANPEAKIKLAALLVGIFVFVLVFISMVFILGRSSVAQEPRAKSDIG